jgi:sulfur-carrier protein
VQQLANRLEHSYRGLSLSGSLCAINEHYAEPEQMIQAGDTVAFFPPVSGG